MSAVSQIASLIGLDDETVQTQILPSLEAYTTRDGLRNHMKTLLGDGSKAAFAIQAYIDSQPRFAPKIVPPLPPASPVKKKGQSIKSALKPAAPRQVTDWSSEFGSSGTVYQKHKDDDGLIWGGSGGGSASGSGSQANSRSGSGRSTPLPLSGQASFKQAAPKKPSGGMTSDLLASKPKADGKKEKPRPPQSEEVQRLETLIGDVESSGEDGTELRKRALKKAKGGCFCMGRIHPLSKYTPQCPSCFLPLCTLQLPFLPCPSCSAPLLNHSTKARLLLTIRAELTAQIAKEEGEKARLEEEAREQAWREAGGGAFPTLGGGPVPKPAAEGPRRVMSLNPKTGKIQMTAYVKRDSPTASRAPSPERDTIVRIARARSVAPTREERDERLRVVLGERAAQGRAFLDVGGLQLRYHERKVEPVASASAGGDDGKKKRRRGRGKGKGKDGGEDGTEVSSSVRAESTVGDEPPSQPNSTLAGDAAIRKGKEKEVHTQLSQLSLDSGPASRSTPTSAAPTAPRNSTYSPSRPPPIRLLTPGTKVLVIQKQDQPTGKQTPGEVLEVLTRGDHPRGVKVRCKGGMVGRVVGLQ